MLYSSAGGFALTCHPGWIVTFTRASARPPGAMSTGAAAMRMSSSGDAGGGGALASATATTTLETSNAASVVLAQRIISWSTACGLGDMGSPDLRWLAIEQCGEL